MTAPTERKTQSVLTILAELSARRATGTLRFEPEPGGELGIEFLFRKGKLLFATSNYRGERLGEFLVRRGALSEAQAIEALEASRKEGRLFHAYLTEEGLVPSELLTDLLYQRTEQLLDLILRAGNGRFIFRATLPEQGDEDAPPWVDQELFGRLLLHRNVWPAIYQTLRDPDLVLRCHPGIKGSIAFHSLSSGEQKLLALLDGRHTVSRILARRRNRIDLMIVLTRFLESGLIEVVPPASATPEPAAEAAQAAPDEDASGRLLVVDEGPEGPQLLLMDDAAEAAEASSGTSLATEPAGLAHDAGAGELEPAAAGSQESEQDLAREREERERLLREQIAAAAAELEAPLHDAPAAALDVEDDEPALDEAAELIAELEEPLLDKAAELLEEAAPRRAASGLEAPARPAEPGWPPASEQDRDTSGPAAVQPPSRPLDAQARPEPAAQAPQRALDAFDEAALLDEQGETLEPSEPAAPTAAAQAPPPSAVEPQPPPLDLGLVPALSPGVKLSDLSVTGLMMDDLFLISQIDGKSSLRELLIITQMPESSVRKVVYRLMERRYITLERRPANVAPASAAPPRMRVAEEPPILRGQPLRPRPGTVRHQGMQSDYRVEVLRPQAPPSQPSPPPIPGTPPGAARGGGASARDRTPGAAPAAGSPPRTPAERARALHAQAVGEYNKDQFFHAEELLRQALHVVPDSALYQARLAVVLLDVQADLDEAEQLADAAIEEDPLLGPCFEALGLVKLRRGELTEARRYLEKAVILDKRKVPSSVAAVAAIKSYKPMKGDPPDQLWRLVRPFIKMVP